MATRRAWVITCDQGGCDAEYETSQENMSDARLRAQDNHWHTGVRVGRKWLDLCPDHKHCAEHNPR